MAGELPDVYLKFGDADGVDLIGDCTDHQHPGDEGWAEIKSFSFGFGFETSTSKAAGSKFTPKGKTIEQLKKEFAEHLNAQQRQQDQKDSKGEDSHEWGHSGALNFERCRISKSADSLSADLVHLVHNGIGVDEITLEACRPGADDNIKAPFLKIIFSDVFFRTCNLRLATEGLPTEEYEFEYGKLVVETWWTDNATGKRMPERPFRVSWDLNANKGDFEAAD